MSLIHQALLAVGVLAGLAYGAGAPPADRADAPVTIWDGVYTEEQAARGAAAYATECASCHGNSGDGSPHAGPIVGSTLEGRWSGGPLAGYFAFIRDQMPPGRPGSLTDRSYAAVLAHVLKLHGAPPGETDLPHELAALVQIIIAPRPDSTGEGPARPTSTAEPLE